MQTKKKRRLMVAGLLGAVVASLVVWMILDSPQSAAQPDLVIAAVELGDFEEPVVDLPGNGEARIEQWVKFLAGRNAARTRLWLERSGRYAPYILQELRKRSMPDDLLYLALIESGFSTTAKSRAKAVGIWQFIAETGKRYGLHIDRYVDSRRDPIASTSAALAYLSELHARFGSWHLAAAAYNTGENRVERILRQRMGGRRGSDDIYWRIARHLPRETRNYVPLMLAARRIAIQPEKYGFSALRYHEPLTFDTVWVPNQVSLDLVARAAAVPAAAIRELNPHLTRGVTPPKRGWIVRIPTGTQGKFAQNFPALYAGELEEAGRVKLASVYTRHTVRRGETLSHIALRYGVSVASLQSANGGVRARRLLPGKSLTIPGRSTTALTSSPEPSSSRFHRVKRGENLSVIAKRYGLSLTRLRGLNELGRRSLIRPGQRLRVE
jgi:peptidoglycan lytic transglycosylase D